jgi:hypothetical protein
VCGELWGWYFGETVVVVGVGQDKTTHPILRIIQRRALPQPHKLATQRPVRPPRRPPAGEHVPRGALQPGVQLGGVCVRREFVEDEEAPGLVVFGLCIGGGGGGWVGVSG